MGHNEVVHSSGGNIADPISNIIKKRRLQLGLTQSKLAKQAGMSDKTYQRIEQGCSDMRLSQYRALINACQMTDLDVSLDLLGVESATAEDVASASRLLLPITRLRLVQSIIEEWQRKTFDDNKTKKGNVR
ncbi:helix-turn-helix domain-containing protein [Photobacterium phosphoreum]|uniref:helix-turn-helix domain-containing protein n=1 Tax=Photobacterium phosphoreum TaxID=659 RepID=UPI002FCCD3F6